MLLDYAWGEHSKGNNQLCGNSYYESYASLCKNELEIVNSMRKEVVRSKEKVQAFGQLYDCIRVDLQFEYLITMSGCKRKTDSTMTSSRFLKIKRINKTAQLGALIYAFYNKILFNYGNAASRYPKFLLRFGNGCNFICRFFSIFCIMTKLIY